MIRLINSIEGLEEVTNYISFNEVIGLDTETSAELPFDGKLLTVQIGDFDNQYVIDVKSIGEEGVATAISEITNKLVIGHNLKFDWKWLFHHLHLDIKNIFDTFIAESILTTGYDRTDRGLSLKTCCDKYLGVKLKKEVRGKIIYEGLTEEVIEYCANDVKYLNILRLRQIEKIRQYYADDTLINLEMKTARVLAIVEYNGILLDTQKWTGVYEETSANRAELEKKLDDVVLAEPKLAKFVNSVPQLEMSFEDLPNKPMRESLVNWRSPVQKLDILRTLGIPAKSTDAKDLIKLRRKHPIVAVLMEYSQANKLASSFGKEFLRNINKHTLRLHTNFFQIVSSGRLSSSEPNLLNIPRRSRLGKVIRSCFVARPGWKLCSADYSNFELRIIAEYAEEPIWDEVFINGGDLHTVLCTKTFDIAESQVNDPFPPKPELPYREVQKTIDFGFNFHYLCEKIKQEIMAEVKPFKFGEPLPDNADGNPEPSSDDMVFIVEGVETRRKVCLKCGQPIPESLYSNAKFCSAKCRCNYNTMLSRFRHGKCEKPFVGSGNNQFGEKNPFWKGGKTLFRKIAFTNYPHICNRCDATNDLLVHHKDKNRLNNNVDNLEILCKKCHQNHHCIRDSITGKYIKG